MKRIEELLVGNGNIMRGLHTRGRSLSAGDRAIILRNRQRALDEGYTRITINALEMEGERGTRGAIGYPVSSRFRGIQETSVRGLSLRLYDIEGDHPLNGSTVTVSTLLGKGIIPTDISFFRALIEATKEVLFMAYFELERIGRPAQNALRRIVKGVAMKKLWLLVAVCILTGCHKANRLTGAESPKDPDAPTPQYELVILSCCYDPAFNGQEVYPSFVPQAHADLCYTTKRNPNQGNLVYIPMHVDCYRTNYVGHEYYEGHPGY